MEQQTSAMQSIAGALDAISKRDGVILQLEKTLEARNQEVELLRKEVEQVKVMQNESEKLHQQDLDQMRKWLGRIASEQNSDK
jgi:hypothetical protein